MPPAAAAVETQHAQLDPFGTARLGLRRTARGMQIEAARPADDRRPVPAMTQDCGRRLRAPGALDMAVTLITRLQPRRLARTQAPAGRIAQAKEPARRGRGQRRDRP